MPGCYLGAIDGVFCMERPGRGGILAWSSSCKKQSVGSRACCNIGLCVYVFLVKVFVNTCIGHGDSNAAIKPLGCLFRNRLLHCTV
jgi:hypothetical protein